MTTSHHPLGAGTVPNTESDYTLSLTFVSLLWVLPFFTVINSSSANKLGVGAKYYATEAATKNNWAN